MLLEEMLRDERTAGRAEGRAEGLAVGRKEISSEYIVDLLSDLGSVPDELRFRIESEDSEIKLKAMHRLAARAVSIEMFLKGLNEID